jgi:hypothetical protein
VKTKELTWDEIAARMANEVNVKLMTVHRGAFNHNGLAVVFGNDAILDDKRSQRQVAEFRNLLKRLVVVSEADGEHGPEELGFGTSDDGYSWAMLVATHKEPSATLDLHELIWCAWEAASGSRQPWLEEHSRQLLWGVPSVSLAP